MWVALSASHAFAADAPTVTGVVPSSAYNTGGDSLTITGTGFAAGAIVTLGGVTAPDVVVQSDSVITATVPASLALGNVRLRVVNSDAQYGETTFTYLAAAPTVTGVTPNRGPASGGQVVTVTGSGFILNESNIQSIVSAYDHSLALTSNGKVYAWGYNANGQLGNGTTTNSIVPVAVTATGVLAGKTVTTITTSMSHSLALTSDGKVYAWGNNGNGQFGNGTTTNSLVPVAVTATGSLAGKTVTAIAAGSSYSLALTSDGKVYAWGSNGYGQLGNNTTTDSSVPVPVTATGSLAGKTVTAIAAGSSYSLALTSDGKVYTWGNNANGQLGNGATTNSLVPVAVTDTGALAGKTVTGVAAFNSYSLGLTSDGKVYAWGNNGNGQFGNGTTTNSLVPVAVTDTGALAGKTVTGVAAGNGYSLALTLDGRVYAWGYNGFGQFGNGTTTNSLVPVAVTDTGVLAGKTVTGVAAGNGYSLALTLDGRVYSWGRNNYGQLGNGNGNITQSSTPIEVIRHVTPPSAAFGVADATDVQFVTGAPSLLATTPPHDPGFVDVTVTNPDGQSSTLENAYEFIATPTLDSATPSTGYVTGGDTVVLSGSNFSEGSTVTIGGVAATITATTPHTITITTPVRAVGAYDVVVTDSLGQKATLTKAFTYTEVPPAIAGVSPNRGPISGGQTVTITGNNFVEKKVDSLVAGTAAFALMSDGQAYGWGINDLGQLGNGLRANSSATPTAVDTTGVLAGKRIKKLSVAGASYTVTADGKVYSWGYNRYGQLGNGTTQDSAVPVAVDMTGVLAGKRVVDIVGNAVGSVTALTSDGKVYSWGRNTNGYLGNGTTEDSPIPVAVDTSGVLAGKTITAIAVGGGSHYALSADGLVYGWGQNGNGQLGNGTTTGSSVPTMLQMTGGLSGKTIKKIFAGSNNLFMIADDGKVYGTGYNGMAGMLGNNSTVQSTTPVPVTATGVLAGKNVVDLAVGSGHVIVLGSDGKVYGWGANNYGQLGNGLTANSLVPVAVTSTGVLSGKTIVAISVGGGHSVALSSDGRVYTWGNGASGQLGDNTPKSSSPLPVAVATTGNLSGKVVASISAASDMTYCVTTEGRVYAWGANASGQLGNSTTVNISTPSRTVLDFGPNVVFGAEKGIGGAVVSPLTISTTTPPHDPGFVDVTVTNPDGQSSTLENAYEFIAPPTLDSVTPSTSYVTGGDTVVLSGSNFSEGSTVTIGGVAATITHLTPNAVTVTTPTQAAGAYDVVITDDFGQKATLEKAFTYVEAPPVVTGVSPNRGPASGGQTVTVTGSGFILNESNIQSVVSGSDHSLALTSDGKVYAWGSNANGQLGNGATTNSLVPVAVTDAGALAGKTVTAIAAGNGYSLALTSDGKVYAWGSNANGQLGNGTTTTSLVPVAVTDTGVLAGKTVTAIAAGNGYSLALTSDGKVYAWGYNAIGQLGNGATTTSLVPVAVTATGVLAGKTVTAIAARDGHSLALASDGKVYAWGSNSFGQLGNNTTTTSSVPVAVTATGVLAGKTVTAISAGNYHSLALTSDGKVYAWGYNYYGQLGNGTNISSSVPVAVTVTGVLAGKTVTALAASMSHSLALTSDGRAYSWGRNIYGQLGNGTATDSLVPVAVTATGALAGKMVTAIAAGNSYSLVLASDGGVYGWGYNGSGQLGNGNIMQSNTPVEAIWHVASPSAVFGAADATDVQFVTGAPSLLVTTPPHDPGFVDVTVTNPDGQSSTLENAYEYVAPPTITAVTPATGSIAGGETVYVSGTNFTENTKVKIGANNATTVFVNATTLLVTTPTSATPGDVDVVVSDEFNQTATATGAYTYTLPAPTITSVAPTYVKMSGGTVSTITGSGFVNRAGGGSWYEVKVDDELATNITYVSATSLRMTTPAHAPGKVSVTIGGAYSEEVTHEAAFEYLPASYAFVNEPRTVMAHEPAELTVTMYDDRGDPISSTEDVTLTLHSSSNTGFFARALTGENAGWDYDTVVVPAGQSSATFYYRDTTSGTPTISVADGLSTTATQQVTIGSPYKILVTGVSNPIPMGTPSSVTVQAVDYLGVPQAEYRGTIHFSSTDGAATLPANYTFTSNDRGRKTFINGVTMGTVGAWDITATDTADTTIQGAQEGIVVGEPASGTISTLKFITAPQSFPLDHTSGVITIQTQDAEGLPIPVAEESVVYLRTNSGTGQFSADNGATWLSTPAAVTIPAGSSFKNVLYRDTTAGTYELKVSQQAATDFGWSVDTQAVTVGVGAPAKFAIQYVQGGAIGQWLPVDIVLMDSADNVVTTEGDVSVGVTVSAGGTVSVSADGSAPHSQVEVTIPTGEHHVTVWVQSVSEPELTVEAADIRDVGEGDRYAAASETIRFGDATPSAVVFSMLPTQTAVKAPTLLQVSLKDQFGNIVMAQDDTAVAIQSDSSAALFAAAESGLWAASQTVTIQAGTTTASVYFKHDTVQPEVVVRATSDGIDDAEGVIQVTAGAYAGLMRFAPTNVSSLTAGETHEFVVELLDAYGNPTIASETVEIGFGTTHPTQAEWNGDAAVRPSAPGEGYTVTVPVGAGEARASYRDTASGSATLQAYDQTKWTRSCLEYAYLNGPCVQYSAWSNASMASRTVTINPDVPVAYAFTSDSQIITKNTVSAALRVELRDQYNNATSFNEATDASLATSSMTGEFSLTGDEPFTATQLHFAAHDTGASFYYRDSRAGPAEGDTVTVAGNGLVEAHQTVRTIEGFAAQAVLDTAGETTAVAGEIIPITLRAQTEEAHDVVVLHDTVFTLSASEGEFSLSDSPFVPITQLTLSAETSQRPLFYRSTTAGMSALSARTAQLEAVPTELAIVSNTFYKLGYTKLPTDNLVEVTRPSEDMVATAYDEYGNVATPSDDQETPVVLATSKFSGQFALALGAWDAHGTTIPAGATTTQPFYYRIGTFNEAGDQLVDSSVLGLQTITASAQDVLPADTQLRVVGALATRIVFTSAAQSVTAGEASARVTLQLRKTDGTPAVTGAAQTVSLSSLNLDSSTDFSAVHGTDVFSLTPGGDPITELTIPAGSSTAEFYVTPQTAEAHRIRVSAAIVNHDGGYLRTVSDVQQLTVVAGAAAKLVVTTVEQTVHPDVMSDPIRFTLTDAYGNIATNEAVRTVQLSSSCASGQFFTNPTGAPTTEVTMNGGENEITLYYKDSAASATPCQLTLQSDGLEDATHAVVVREPVYALAITSAPRSVEAGGTSAPIVVETRDRFGNTVTVESPLTVSFAAPGVTSTLTPTSQTIGRGGSSTQFTFRYDGATTVPLQVRVQVTDTAGQVMGAEQQVTVTPGAVAASAFSTSAYSTIVGEYQPLNLQVVNAYGKRTVASGELSFNLTTSSAAGAFYRKVGADYEPLSTIAVADGAAQSTTFYYRQTQATKTQAGVDTPAVLGAQRSGVGTAVAQATVLAKTLSFSTGNFSAQARTYTPLKVSLSSPLPTDITVNLSTTNGTGAFYASNIEGAEPITSITIAAGQTQSAEFFYRQENVTTSGLPSILTAAPSASPLTVWSGRAQASFYATQFNSLVFVAPQPSLEQGERATYTVEARDNLGNVVPFTNSEEGYCLYIGSSSSTAEIVAHENAALNCLDTADKKALYVSRFQTRVSFAYKDTTTGEATLTAATNASAGGTRTTTDVSITDAMTSRVTFDRTQYGLVRGDELSLSLTLMNTFGFEANSLGNTTVTLSSNSATGRFFNTTTHQWTATLEVVFEEGQTTYSDILYSDTTNAASATLHAAASGLTAGQAVVNLGTGALDGLKFTSAPQTIERGQLAQLTIGFVDEFNNDTPALHDLCLYVTSSGAAGLISAERTNQNCTNVTLPGGVKAYALYVPAGATTASFTYQTNETGEVTFDVSTLPAGGGITTSHTLTSEDGAAARVGILPLASTLERGGVLNGQLVLYNAYNAEVSASHDTVVRLTSDFIDGTYALDGDGPWVHSLDVMVREGESRVSFLYQTDKEYLGTTTLTAQDSAEDGLEASTASVTVVMGAVAQLVFATPERTTTATHPSEVMTIEARNRYGVATVATNDLPLYVRSTSTTGSFATSTIGPWGMSTVKILAGQSQTDVYYRDDTVGSPVLTVRDKLSPQEGEEYLATTQQHHIVAQEFSHFIVTNISSPTKTGLASSVVVFAVDSENYVVADYSGTITFSSDDPAAILPARYVFKPDTDRGIHTFTNGVAFKTAGLKSVTATDMDGKQGTQFDIVVEAGNTAPVRALHFTDTHLDVNKAERSHSLMLTLHDQTGALTNAPAGGMPIHLTADSETGEFSTDGVNWSANLTITVEAGLSFSTTPVYYRDSTGGAAIITAHDWIASTDSALIENAQLPVTVNDIALRVDQQIFSTDSTGAMVENPYLFSYNDKGEIRGYTTLAATTQDVNGDELTSDWMVAVADEPHSIANTAHIAYTSQFLMPVVGATAYPAVVEASHGTLGARWQGSVPVSPWRAALGEAVIDDTVLYGSLTTTQFGELADSPQAVLRVTGGVTQVLRTWQVSDLLASGLAQQVDRGTITFRVPLRLFAGGDYTVAAQISDGHGIIAEDAAQFTIQTPTDTPGVPVTPGATTPGTGTGTLSPETPGDTSSRPEPIQPVPPRDGAYEQHEAGLLTRILRSPETPVRVAQSLLGLLIIVAVVLLYQVYREWRHARFLLAIIRRDNETIVHKDNFLQLAAHHLRTPLTLLTSGGDMMKRTAAATGRGVEQMTSAVAALREKAEAILTQTGTSDAVALIATTPTEKVARRTIYRSPIVWVPLALSVALTIITNMLVRVYGEQTLSAGTIAQQIILLLIGGVLVYTAARMAVQRREQRKVLEQSRAKVRALNTAKITFARKVSRELTDDILHLNGYIQQVQPGADASVASILAEGLERLERLVARFTVLNSVYESQPQQTVINVARVVDEALQTARQQNPAVSVAMNEEVETLTASRSGWFVTRLFQDIFASMAPLAGGGVIKVETHRSRDTTEVVITGPAQHDAPAEDLFSVYSRSDQETAGTFSTDDQDSRMHRLDLYLDQMIADELQATLSADRVRGRARVAIALPNAG